MHWVKQIIIFGLQNTTFSQFNSVGDILILIIVP